jgi:DNA-binding NarL/FixJ family response regulator
LVNATSNKHIADARPRPNLLTPRELEVAGLVSRGLSNRGIGEALGIARATATLHVEHVRGKLGFHSRAQIAVWVALGMPLLELFADQYKTL